MNVYVRQAAVALARRGVRMILLTRAEEPVGADGARVRMLDAGGQAPPVTVVDLAAGPSAPVPKEELAGLGAEFTRAALDWLASDAVPGGPVLGGADAPPVAFVHGHYWLSGSTAAALARAAHAPYLQTMHTTAAAKMLEDPELREPAARIEAEREVAERADLLVVNSAAEVADLRELLDVPRARTRVLPPGPTSRRSRRRAPRSGRAPRTTTEPCGFCSPAACSGTRARTCSWPPSVCCASGPVARAPTRVCACT